MENTQVSAAHTPARPILLPVWNEMKLVKADVLFQLCYTKFAHEIGRIPQASTPRPQVGSVEINNMMEILTTTEKSYLLWPKSPGFERLIETISLALQLRILRAYGTHSPNHLLTHSPNHLLTPDKGSSPVHLIKSMTDIKKRDLGNHTLSYVTLLQQEITELQFQYESQSLSDKVLTHSLTHSPTHSLTHLLRW
jgi:hypothetical protein